MTTARRAIPWIGGVTIAGMPLLSMFWLSVPSVLLLGIPTWTAEALWYSLPGRSHALYFVLTILPYVLVPLGVGWLFIALCRRIARHPDRVRPVLLGSLLVTMVLSALWHLAGWSYGAQYQGLTFILVNLAISGLLVVVMILVAAAWRRRRAPELPMLFLWIELFWILGFAFPWLGEMW